MFSELNDFESGRTLHADICIVGAGPAGISITRELLGDSTRVLLLESGHFEFDGKNQQLYKGTELYGIPPLPIDESRLRFFGGTSNHWAGECGPFDPLDFQERSWASLSGWPMTRESLDSYYERAHKLLGITYDYSPNNWNDEHTPLLSFPHTSIRHKVRQQRALRFGKEFRQELRLSDTAHVILGANLVQILTQNDGKTVTALRIKSLQGTDIIVNAGLVVLACSGIENARIMLASQGDSGFPLGNRYDNVGRHYMLHPAFYFGVLLLSRPMNVSPQNPYLGYSPIGDGFFRYGLGLSDELQEKEEILNHLVLLKRFRPLDDTTLDVTRMLGDLDKSWLQAREGQQTRMAELEMLAEQLPNRNSRILLDDERDALGTPRVKVDWRWTETEPTMIQRFCELFAREVGSSNLGRVKLLDNLDDEGHLKQLYQKRGGGTHHMGTTRMSISPKDGVVDVNCQVHGMSNLFCAGSSVFPTSSWVNPTLTILALSIRLADHLKRLLRA